MQPRLLDLFCGQGGAAMGYHRAGFHIIGVDHRPMPRYPFEFVQADALDFAATYGRDFDAIHTSPPCQRYSIATECVKGAKEKHADLLGPTLRLLQEIETPWIVENVERAPFSGYTVILCGLMFGLKVLRHRRFASSAFLFSPPHKPHTGKRIGVDGMCCVAGHGCQSSGFGKGKRRRIPADHRTKSAWSRAMGIDWMTREGLAQAIPPAYTEYLGRQLMRLFA